MATGADYFCFATTGAGFGRTLADLMGDTDFADGLVDATAVLGRATRG